MGQREDQYLVTLFITNPRTGAVEDWGTWDMFDGGETDSEERRRRSGGMGPEKSLGGPRTVSNITMNRAYELVRDHLVIKTLRGYAGRARVTVSKQPLDADANKFGDPEVFTGVLKKVASPNHDAQSADDAVVEIEITPDETVA